MFTAWFARRRHLHDVRISFCALLAGFPRRTVDTLWNDYSDSIRSMSRERYRESAMRVAFDLVLAILPQQIAGLDEAERREVLDDFLSHVQQKTSPASVLTRGLLHVEQAVFDVVGMGGLDANDRTVFVSEVLGALEGKTFAERSGERIAAVLVAAR